MTRLEFETALRLNLGFIGKEEVVWSLFRSLDKDDDGTLSMTELYEFLSGKEYSLKREPDEEAFKSMETLRLLPPRRGAPADASSGKVWSVDQIWLLKEV